MNHTNILDWITLIIHKSLQYLWLFVCVQVGRAFSFNKTPSKLKRAVSTVISPLTNSAARSNRTQVNHSSGWRHIINKSWLGPRNSRSGHDIRDENWGRTSFYLYIACHLKYLKFELFPIFLLTFLLLYQRSPSNMSEISLTTPGGAESFLLHQSPACVSLGETISLGAGSYHGPTPGHRVSPYGHQATDTVSGICRSSSGAVITNNSVIGNSVSVDNVDFQVNIEHHHLQLVDFF